MKMRLAVLVVIKTQSTTFCHRAETTRIRVMKKDSLDTQLADMAANVTTGVNLRRA